MCACKIGVSRERGTEERDGCQAWDDVHHGVRSRTRYDFGYGLRVFLACGLGIGHSRDLTSPIKDLTRLRNSQRVSI